MRKERENFIHDILYNIKILSIYRHSLEDANFASHQVKPYYMCGHLIFCFFFFKLVFLVCAFPISSSARFHLKSNCSTLELNRLLIVNIGNSGAVDSYYIFIFAALLIIKILDELIILIFLLKELLKLLRSLEENLSLLLIKT